MAKNKGPVLFPPCIFNVYKPVGISSFSVVNHFKRNLPEGYGKIGHFGTLDPFADGILLIGIAGACRLNHQVHRDLIKTYRATGVFGTKTISGDIESIDNDSEVDGDVDNKLRNRTIEELETIFKEKFLGKYSQVPPAFSATKYKGKPLYKWARQGTMIKKDPVEREIFDIKVISLSGTEIVFDVTASTGTYIRTLFEDMACLVGTFGYLKSLTRSRIGHLLLENSIKLKDWPSETIPNESYPLELGLGLKDVLNFDLAKLDTQKTTRFLLGNPVTHDGPFNQAEIFVFNSKNEIIGFGYSDDEKIYPKVNFSRSTLVLE